MGADDGGDDSGDDADLEAELAALTTGSATRRPKKKPPPPTVNLDAMVAASMRDVPSDEEFDSADENDPELLVSCRFKET
jgi:coiled-coil and C2 domain-containing protein 1